ncbi:hypothetical protein DET57_10521 [Klebsiella oxytoca]|uniref:Uncharacterized protein n=1 Tax=Klebsiella oxytoca TaxID=571 RepID=A0A318FV18_KLEOX|nr:hypothetical protein [Klebsiella oxytoca]PXW46351.1 hypothetical protein DET57_10521 [Klebsiella oxytoca]
MNIFLTDLVTLNKVILANAKKQFYTTPEHPVNFLATANALPDNLTASICTETVSGQLRYCIVTETDGISWTLNLYFTLDQPIDSIPYVVLNFSTRGKNYEMIFSSVTQVPGNHQYKARLKLTNLEQRDALLQALSVYESHTTLVVAIKSSAGIRNTITNPQTFLFPENIYPYIYKGILPPSLGQSLQIIPIPYKNINCNYYQDYIRKDDLYYLPDTFELATYEDKPLLSIAFTADEQATSVEQIRVTFSYYLLPVVDQERITNATAKFKEIQPQGKLLPSANARKLKLMLSVPTPDGMIELKEKQALINLQSGIADAFTIPGSQFAKIWDALFKTSPNSLLLKGYLTVSFPGFNNEKIPVKLLMNKKHKENIKDFVDEDSVVNIRKKITFITENDIYSSDFPKPIKRIQIKIQDTSLTLDKNNLQKTVSVYISALTQILSPTEIQNYRYDMVIYYLDGSRHEYPQQTSEFEDIYLP